MTYTVLGVLADPDGLASNPEARTTHWASPAAGYRADQPRFIGVDRDHDGRWVGRVVYLERRHGNLWCVAEVDDTPTVAVRVGNETVHVETPLYFSAETHSDHGRDIVLRSVALTAFPARLDARPVRWFAGGLDRRSAWNLDWHIERGLIGRAGEARHTQHGQRSLLIAGDRPPHPIEPAQRTGELLLRSAETLGVRPASRTIELIVVPYEQPTPVVHQGRMVTETISRGAFDGVERQANHIRVNRDHALERTVGQATRLNPRDQRGLHAEVRITRTGLGDETLALAADGCLDASAAFRPNQGGQQWQGSDSYRITSAWLHHIALTPDPAYPGARVLAVQESTAS